MGAAAPPPLYVPWPCGDTYKVTQGHNGGSHTGESSWAWDIGIPEGGEVAAPADGVVSHVRMNQTQSGCDPAYATKANYVVIELADGTQAQMAHLQANSSTLRVGDRVRKGDIVGKVGRSGYICGVHLHFKIQTPCRYFTCPSVPASFVEFGDPRAGTTITSNNCQAPEETTLVADAFDQTMSDVDGDGAADVCARGVDGIECALSRTGPLSVNLTGPALSDAQGWSDVSNFSTLRLADVTGDGRADLCARANAGIRCWPSVGDGFEASFAGPDLDDASNWNLPQYYATLRTPDIDGDGRADLCARGAAGLICFRSTGAGFEPGVSNGQMSDADGWDRAEYYSTLRMADIDGDGRDDACARDSDGLVCWLSDGVGFTTEIRGPAWADEVGWSDPSNYTTIRFGDLDGDGRADVCARANAGLRCYLSDGTGFGEAITGPAWSDDEGWSDVSQYATIALADIDGDGVAEACGRAIDGIQCWSAANPTAIIQGPPWSTDAGWDTASTAYTIRFADVNGDGRADVCGRAPDGYQCWWSRADQFVAAPTAGIWADATGTSTFSTIRLGGTAPIAQESTVQPPGSTAIDESTPPVGEEPGGSAGAEPDAEHAGPTVIRGRGGCATATGRPAATGLALGLLVTVWVRAPRRRRSLHTRC